MIWIYFHRLFMPCIFYRGYNTLYVCVSVCYHIVSQRFIPEDLYRNLNAIPYFTPVLDMTPWPTDRHKISNFCE